MQYGDLEPLRLGLGTNFHQMVSQQIDALHAAGCVRIYKDKAVKATARKRPGLAAVRKALKPGDTFVITSIDRAFRSFDLRCSIRYLPTLNPKK